MLDVFKRNNNPNDKNNEKSEVSKEFLDPDIVPIRFHVIIIDKNGDKKIYRCTEFGFLHHCGVIRLEFTHAPYSEDTNTLIVEYIREYEKATVFKVSEYPFRIPKDMTDFSPLVY